MIRKITRSCSAEDFADGLGFPFVMSFLEGCHIRQLATWWQKTLQDIPAPSFELTPEDSLSCWVSKLGLDDPQAMILCLVRWASPPILWCVAPWDGLFLLEFLWICPIMYTATYRHNCACDSMIPAHLVENTAFSSASAGLWLGHNTPCILPLFSWSPPIMVRFLQRESYDTHRLTTGLTSTSLAIKIFIRQSCMTKRCCPRHKINEFFSSIA